MVAMETAAPHRWLLQFYVLPYQQRGLLPVLKLIAHMRTNRLIEGYVWAKMKQYTACTYNALNFWTFIQHLFMYTLIF